MAAAVAAALLAEDVLLLDALSDELPEFAFALLVLLAVVMLVDMPPDALAVVALAALVKALAAPALVWVPVMLPEVET